VAEELAESSPNNNSSSSSPTRDTEGQQEQRDEFAQDEGSDDDLSDDEGKSSNESYDALEERFHGLEEEVAILVADVHDLALYTKLNITGFMKILKVGILFSLRARFFLISSSSPFCSSETRCKSIFFVMQLRPTFAQKQTNVQLKTTFIQEYLEKRPFYKYNWDALIVKLSKLYDLVRTRGQPIQGDSSAGGNQSAFIRQTTKYWVHPDNLVPLKLAILRNLPVLGEFLPSDGTYLFGWLTLVA